MPGLAGSGRDGKKYRFLIKFLLKSSDFDCPGWPGAAGMEKYRFLIKFFEKSNNFDCPGWPGAAGMEKIIDF